MSVKGIDVASFQHPNGAAVDWHKVKEDGYTFVVVKATEGVGYRNPFFASDVAGARAAGLDVGAYHFFHGNEDGVAQANKFLEAVAGVRVDLPLGIDFEDNFGADPALTHYRLDQFRTVVRQHGHKTMTYTYPNFWKEYGSPTCKFCAADALWFSETGVQSVTAPAPWKSVTIWQYSAEGTVPGVEGHTDLDNFLFDEAAWQGFLASGATPQPAGPPAWYRRLLAFPVTANSAKPTKTVGGVTYEEGDDVATVQRKLAIKPDGLFGPATEAHVKGFQQAHGLRNDGIVGPATAEKLGA